MKLFMRRKPATKDEGDLLQLGIMRQQVTANETNYLLGMTTQMEYEETKKRLEEQLKELERKYEDDSK